MQAAAQTTSAVQSPSQKVAAAFEEFRQVQHKLSSFGAADTEPDAVMQVCVARHLGYSSKPLKIPKTAEDWELYTDTKGVGAAARKLTSALNKLLKKLGQLYLKSAEAKRAIRNSLWRVSI